MEKMHQSTMVKFMNKEHSKDISNLSSILASCMDCMSCAEQCVTECDSSKNCVKTCIAVSEVCSAFIRMCNRGIMDKDFVNTCIELCNRCCKYCQEGSEQCCKRCNTACESFANELKKCFC